ncbi:MAG: precorrin-6y C5,15-methyltransferase (decarboxylating) subunit CbiE [Thermodesulfobacterium sp.]|nr:precorrin-6y C5,15-methyltransferase (decarboxylating) subunit CbiE [Thermodesulfobacterium sp.]
MENKIYLIGIGFKPLEKEAEECLLGSHVILGFFKTIELFKNKYFSVYEKVRFKIKVLNKVEELLEEAKRGLSLGDVTLLASGDPLYFGIGKRVIDFFGKERIQVFPDLSSLQKATSLIKENWWEIPSLSFHNRPLDLALLLNKLYYHQKLALLTDPVNTPSFIASCLKEKGLGKEIIFWVFEKMGTEEEKVFRGTPEEIARKTFKEPNFLILTLEPQKEKILFGLKEEEIFHLRGMITKDEVRAVVLHQLRVPREGVLWDIGAGSGSVSLECALLSSDLKVYAIEKEASACELIQKNIERFKVFNVEVIKGLAPEVLTDLKKPDRVFIGGSGGKLKEILEFLNNLDSLPLVVLTAISLETLNISLKFFKEKNWNFKISQIGISRVEPLGSQLVFKAQNPIFVIRAQKG